MGSMQEMENKAENESTNSKVYEVGYLLVPTISSEEVPAVYGNIKELITSLGGDIISDEMPQMTVLAYPMLKVVTNIRNKFNTAYFGWVKFEMGSQKVLELKKKLDLDVNIVRFLTLKTVKENTIASKRFIHRDPVKHKVSTKEEGAEPVEIDDKEIDKEIEAMIEV